MADVPSRLREIDICYFWFQTGEPEAALRRLFRADQMLVVSCPEACPQLLADFGRGGGLRLLYISIYKAPLLAQLPPDAPGWKGGSPARASAEQNPFWRQVNLQGHPEWILYGAAGQPRRPFDDPNYMPGWQRTAPSVAHYQEAVARGIQAVAQDGRFDGVYLDNFIPGRCGQALPWLVLDDTGHYKNCPVEVYTEAFYDLTRHLRQRGQSASPAGKYFWLVINGECDPRAQALADSLVIESFMFSWAWPGSRLTDAAALEKLGQFESLRARGGRPTVLCYFGFSGHPLRQDATRVRRVLQQGDAIFADMLTLARPALLSSFARANLKQSGHAGPPGPNHPAVAALAHELPGDLELAREMYNAPWAAVRRPRHSPPHGEV